MEPVPCDRMWGHIEVCPSCVAFLRDLRAAVAPRLYVILTCGYLRMLALPSAK